MTEKVTEADLRLIRTTNPSDGGATDTAATSSLMKMLATLDRHLLQELMVEQRFSPGDIIFHEGDPGDALYIIWAGRVAVVKGRFSRPDELFFRAPGEIVGDMALLENKPRWASLVAVDHVRLLRIERDSFYKLLQAHPTVSLNLLALLSARLRASHESYRAERQPDKTALRQISTLMDENEQLIALHQVRQETSDLIIHDLRSPLGNIYSVLNMLELVLPEDVLSANRELLDIAHLAQTRMQDLIDSLLDVSLLETGSLDIERTPANLGAIIDEVLRLAAFAVERRTIEFETNLEPDLPLLMIDGDRIRRVLTNLIDNAIKFTPEHGRVRIEVIAQDQMVRVSVEDSGPGIPLADHQRIFDRFAQVQRTGLRRTRGYGLGLAFCRLTIEAHGGRIWVEPVTAEVGSRFVFTLPIQEPIFVGGKDESRDIGK